MNSRGSNGRDKVTHQRNISIIQNVCSVPLSAFRPRTELFRVTIVCVVVLRSVAGWWRPGDTSDQIRRGPGCPRRVPPWRLVLCEGMDYWFGNGKVEVEVVLRQPSPAHYRWERLRLFPFQDRTALVL